MSRQIHVEDETEALIAQQAVETFRALRQAVKTAPHGHGLATVEAVVREKGFEHLSVMYQNAVREHPEAQKGACGLTCDCGKNASFRRVTPKHLLSTVGAMNVGRRYYACRSCGRTYTPFDEWAGMGSIQVTEHARKIIVSVSTAWSFDHASVKLAEICSMKVSDDTIERVCQDEGERARRWLRGAEELVQSFEQASGEPEFYSDGLKINTPDGWREMRLNLLQKRQRALPARPEQWKDRVLPEASVRLAGCAIADCRLTGAMWKQWSGKMGRRIPGNSVSWPTEPRGYGSRPACGSAPNAQWCVDIYHVSKHLHDCAKKMFGEGQVARSWAEEGLEELIRLAGPKFIAQLDQRIESSDHAEHAAALQSLRTYLDANRDRMWYAKRLARGQPIGSGAIEGACKKIGTRLKLNSARWRPRRAERFGALLCLEYTDQWGRARMSTEIHHTSLSRDVGCVASMGPCSNEHGN